jgi:hypothetical protein
MADFKNVKIINLKDLETVSELTKRVEELETANAKLRETKRNFRMKKWQGIKLIVMHRKNVLPY